MSDNDGKEETMREQQQDLFRELSREQLEAEKAIEEKDHDQSAKAKLQEGSDD